eukprot:TRINITY_DN2314_c0_g1_i2.p1 TRINITY_DN2314_c0_g1~~TRINITY_DN2314_c0_g1_i2.p1  ORF type:complete len:2961 (-),score=848.04 TRINITY_DN2314_c0_g1_i2:37-8919(-)
MQTEFDNILDTITTTLSSSSNTDDQQTQAIPDNLVEQIWSFLKPLYSTTKHSHWAFTVATPQIHSKVKNSQNWLQKLTTALLQSLHYPRFISSGVVQRTYLPLIKKDTLFFATFRSEWIARSKVCLVPSQCWDPEEIYYLTLWSFLLFTQPSDSSLTPEIAQIQLKLVYRLVETSSITNKKNNGGQYLDSLSEFAPKNLKSWYFDSVIKSLLPASDLSNNVTDFNDDSDYDAKESDNIIRASPLLSLFFRQVLRSLASSQETNNDDIQFIKSINPRVYIRAIWKTLQNTKSTYLSTPHLHQILNVIHDSCWSYYLQILNDDRFSDFSSKFPFPSVRRTVRRQNKSLEHLTILAKYLKSKAIAEIALDFAINAAGGEDNIPVAETVFVNLGNAGLINSVSVLAPEASKAKGDWKTRRTAGELMSKVYSSTNQRYQKQQQVDDKNLNELSAVVENLVSEYIDMVSGVTTNMPIGNRRTLASVIANYLGDRNSKLSKVDKVVEVTVKAIKEQLKQFAKDKEDAVQADQITLLWEQFKVVYNILMNNNTSQNNQQAIRELGRFCYHGGDSSVEATRKRRGTKITVLGWGALLLTGDEERSQRQAEKISVVGDVTALTKEELSVLKLVAKTDSNWLTSETVVKLGFGTVLDAFSVIPSFNFEEYNLDRVVSQLRQATKDSSSDSSTILAQGLIVIAERVGDNINRGAEIWRRVKNQGSRGVVDVLVREIHKGRTRVAEEENLVRYSITKHGRNAETALAILLRQNNPMQDFAIAAMEAKINESELKFEKRDRKDRRSQPKNKGLTVEEEGVYKTNIGTVWIEDTGEWKGGETADNKKKPEPTKSQPGKKKTKEELEREAREREAEAKKKVELDRQDVIRQSVEAIVNLQDTGLSVARAIGRSKSVRVIPKAYSLVLSSSFFGAGGKIVNLKEALRTLRILADGAGVTVDIGTTVYKLYKLRAGEQFNWWKPQGNAVVEKEVKTRSKQVEDLLTKILPDIMETGQGNEDDAEEGNAEPAKKNKRPQSPTINTEAGFAIVWPLLHEVLRTASGEQYVTKAVNNPLQVTTLVQNAAISMVETAVDNRVKGVTQSTSKAPDEHVGMELIDDAVNIMTGTNTRFIGKAQKIIKSLSELASELPNSGIIKLVSDYAVLSHDSECRKTCLEGVSTVSDANLNNYVKNRAWIALFDTSKANQKLSIALVKRFSKDFNVNHSLVQLVYDDFEFRGEGLREGPRDQLATALVRAAGRTRSDKELANKVYQLGNDRSPEVRSGAMSVLRSASEQLVTNDYASNNIVFDNFKFLIENTLGDDDDVVRNLARIAGQKWIEVMTGLNKKAAADEDDEDDEDEEDEEDDGSKANEAEINALLVQTAGEKRTANFNKETCDSIRTRLFKLLDNYLSAAEDSRRGDRVRESVIVFLGTIAEGLEPKKNEKDKARVKEILEKCLQAIDVPAESVQKGIAGCVSGLVKTLNGIPSEETYIEELVKKLITRLCQAGAGVENYAIRRGAAFAIAGTVKGYGVSLIKKLNIVTTMVGFLKRGGAKDVWKRQGALLCFECLSQLLKVTFEPYVTLVIPRLLVCFEDNSPHVRESASDASRAIMANLTFRGVKLVLPALQKVLDQDSTEMSGDGGTKVAAIEILGNMAFCAPKQLGSCLPEVVPRLLEVLLGETHRGMTTAARAALGQISSCARNPELTPIIPTVILPCLDSPEDQRLMNAALDKLLSIEFVHTIDVPSLSLIMPLIKRAIKSKGGGTNEATRKKAIQILGKMCQLADKEALLPYMQQITPDLRSAVIDPIPDIRTVSSRALGELIRGLGSDVGGANALKTIVASVDPDDTENEGRVTNSTKDPFEDLVPWLLTTMQSNLGSVERGGAAQALAEVLNSAPESARLLEQVLPVVLTGCSNIKAHVREGFLSLFVWLPRALRHQLFITKVLRDPQVMDTLLQALADEMENVRDIGMRAGQAIISSTCRPDKSKATKQDHEAENEALDIMIPPLLEGLFDENPRIRSSAVQLLGDLLFHFLERPGEEGPDANAAANVQGIKVLSAALGEEREMKILARLYVIRSGDSSASVRQQALLVWKTVVENTPRTLRRILPVLMDCVLKDCLGSNGREKRELGSKTLGDLVSRLGERILPEIVPILQKGLLEGEKSRKIGTCLALGSVINSAASHQIASYLPSLIPAVRQALCDESPDIRASAAEAFDTLYKAIGNRAVDEILPQLLNQLIETTGSNSELILDALKQILTVRAAVVLPTLIPRLVGAPIPQTSKSGKVYYTQPKVAGITPANARALEVVAEVSGPALFNHFDVLLSSLLDAGSEGGESASKKIIQSVVSGSGQTGGSEGVRLLFNELLKLCEETNPLRRRGAAQLIAEYFKACQANSVAGSTGMSAGLSALIAAGSQSRWSGKDILNTGDKTGAVLSGLLRPLLRLLCEPAEDSTEMIRSAAADAFANLTKAVPKEVVPLLAPSLKSNLVELERKYGKNVTAADGNTSVVLEGLSSAVALDAILTIFCEGLSKSPSAEWRIQAAKGLQDTVRLSPQNAIVPYVVKITGVLIRAIGERFSAQVKIAALSTLRELLGPKGGGKIRPFVPQLQTTFVKALGEPDSAEGEKYDDLRQEAAKSIGQLMGLLVRVDTLITDLCTGALNNTGSGRQSYVKALEEVLLSKVGFRVKKETLQKVGSTLNDLLTRRDEEGVTREYLSRAIAAYACSLDYTEKDTDGLVKKSDELIRYIKSDLIGSKAEKLSAVSGALSDIILIAGKFGHKVTGPLSEVIQPELERIGADGTGKVADRSRAVTGLGRTLIRIQQEGEEELNYGSVKKVLAVFNKSMKGATGAELQVAVAREVERLSREGIMKGDNSSEDEVVEMMLELLGKVRERSVQVKLAGEKAMYWMLRVGEGDEGVEKMAGELEKRGKKREATGLRDYVKRVLKRTGKEEEKEKVEEEDVGNKEDEEVLMRTWKK